MAEDDDVKAWIGRGAAFVGFAAVATIAALGVWFAMFDLGVGGDDLFWASIVHLPLVVLAAVACGLVVGAAGASGRTLGGRLRRAVAVSLVLLATGAAAILGWSALPEPSFSAAEFRSAAAAGDDETLEREAYRAVEQEALIGLSAARVREKLGPPPRIGRRSHQWIWHVGMINDAIGPGDGGALYVRFDPSWSRVTAAKVAQSGY